MTNRLTILLLLLYFSLQSSGQGFVDLVRLESVNGLNQTNYDQLSAYSLHMQVPVPIKNHFILTGINVERTNVDLDTVGFQSSGVTFSVGWVHNFKNGKSLVLGTQHRFPNQDFAIGTDYYQLGLAGIFTYKKTEKVKYQIGFYTNNEFLGRMVTPLFGIDWKISDRWRFYGLLPANGFLVYQPNERWRHGVQFHGQFQSYRQFGGSPTYLQRASNIFSLFSELYLSEKIVFQANLGFQTWSSYKTYGENDKVKWSLNLVRFGDDRVLLKELLANGPVVGFKLIFRYPTE